MSLYRFIAVNAGAWLRMSLCVSPVQVHVHDTGVEPSVPVVGHLVPVRAVVVQARSHPGYLQHTVYS